MRSLLLLGVLPLLAGDLPPADKVRVVKVFEVPHYCEGIVFDHEGNGYISHGEFITTFSQDGKNYRTWTTTTVKGKDGKVLKGAPNGHKILADGTHLVCDGNHHAVLHLSADGKILGKAAAECDGKALRAPNDLTLDPLGGFYFTDPANSDDKKPDGTIHYTDARGKTHLVASGLAYPNGIVLRPGGKELLVAESKKNRVLVFPVRSPGKVGPMRVFADLPAKKGEQIDNQPDGMCLDADGNLYVAHFGMRQVQVLDRQGKLIRRYPGGNLTTSNVGFGGPHLNSLFITGGLGEGRGGGLFRINFDGVRGLVILPPKQEK
jgi:gluconolactonase